MMETRRRRISGKGLVRLFFVFLFVVLPIVFRVYCVLCIVFWLVHRFFQLHKFDTDISKKSQIKVW